MGKEKYKNLDIKWEKKAFVTNFLTAFFFGEIYKTEDTNFNIWLFESQ